MSKGVLEHHKVGLRRGGRWLLRHFSWSVAAGDFIWLRGANGSGKTSLLRLCAGLLIPSEGSVHRAPGLKVCFLASQPALLGDFSVLENLNIWCRVFKISYPKSQMLEILNTVDLAHKASVAARDLSTGQQRRLTLSYLQAVQPDVALLDEPHHGLDKSGVLYFQTLLQQFSAKGVTVVMSSHDEDFGLHATGVLNLDVKHPILESRSTSCG